REQALDFVESVEVPDPRTVTVRWKQPFIEADRLFSRRSVAPMPEHLLRQTYVDDKARLLDLPYWNVEYVGTGPFKLKEWARGSHMTFAANDSYTLGRPKIDEVEVRFIPDPNTMLANVLAGAVEVTLGKSISHEQAIEAQSQWQAGTIEAAPGNS